MRRLNRVPLLIAGFMLVLIIGAVFYTTQMRIDQRDAGGQAGGDTPEPVTGQNIPLPPPTQTKPVLPPPTQVTDNDPQIESPTRVAPQPVDPYAREWERYQQELERMRLARNQVMIQALRSQTPVSSFRGQRGGRAQADEEGGDLGELSKITGQYSSMATAAASRAEQLALTNGFGTQTQDLNRAAEKRAFLTERNQQSRDKNYLQGGREAPLSPYEIKAGTVIPAVMIGGINSDLPGQILGQVSQDIYDSATGRYILIPQGSKLIGNYDNSVTHGQERVLVVWNRIIYPDGSSVDLGSMPGVDVSGYAGMHDKVNTHFWKMFGSALMLSILSAGVQLSQGDVNNTSGNDAQATIAAGLGQQMTQLGQTLLERDSQIQPTLEIRQGYNFSVMVTKDMILRPWTGNNRIGAQ